MTAQVLCFSCPRSLRNLVAYEHSHLSSVTDSCSSVATQGPEEPEGLRFSFSRCSGYFKSSTVKLQLLLLSYENIQEYVSLGALCPAPRPALKQSNGSSKSRHANTGLGIPSLAWHRNHRSYQTIDSKLLRHSRPGLRPRHLSVLLKLS